jgi:hypothetical protein
MNGCFDVAITHQKDRGINIWCIHIYTEAQKDENGETDPNFQPRRTHYHCVGDPYHFRLRSIEDPLHDPDDYVDYVNFTKSFDEEDVDEADEALTRVPMDNADPFFSSQIWVFDVLDSLYDYEFFPDDEFEVTHSVLSHLHQRLVAVARDIDG